MSDEDDGGARSVPDPKSSSARAKTLLLSVGAWSHPLQMFSDRVISQVGWLTGLGIYQFTLHA